jgi:hypothetical protein
MLYMWEERKIGEVMLLLLGMEFRLVRVLRVIMKRCMTEDLYFGDS